MTTLANQQHDYIQQQWVGGKEGRRDINILSTYHFNYLGLVFVNNNENIVSRDLQLV